MHIAILAPSDSSFISDFLPSIKKDDLPVGYNGAPFIGTIIKGLLLQNHQITAITTTLALNNDYKIREFSHANFKWIVIPQRPHSLRPNGKKIGRIIDLYGYEINELTKAIQKINPDFVHAHWSYEFASAALKSKLPCLITIHDNAWQVLRFFKNIYRSGRLLMAEFNLRKTRYSSTVSTYMLHYVSSRCKETRIIPNPVIVTLDDSKIEALSANKIKRLDCPQVFMVNNGWNNLKNGMVGLKAFYEFRKIYPDSELHLFGSDSEPRGLAYQDAISIGLDTNVIYHGAISHSELMDELKKCHLLLHPALEESFGVVLIEAMSLGIPVIGGIRSGAVPWVINDNDLLVNVKNTTELTNKMVEILSNSKFYKLKSMSVYKNVCSRFSADSVVCQYLQYYSDILNNW